MRSEDILRAMLARQTKTDEPLLLSTGSTLLNLEMTGRPEGGWMTGHYFLFVGDSDSGKSWFMHTALAEASINPAFKRHRLIYDQTERKGLIDLPRYFGNRLADRIEPPSESDGEPVFSSSTEQFYYHVDDALKAGRPFIYILDSQDTLTTRRESTKFEKKKAKARGRKVEVSDGDYTDGKAQAHSSNLRQFITPLANLNSLLIIVNQSRDSFDMFNKDAFSGGRALKFYAVCQLWSYKGPVLKKVYRKKKRQQGITSRVAIKKNHITGREGQVDIPIYHSHGIDDVGCCVDWLLDEGVWKKNKNGVIKATGIGPTIEAQYEKLIRTIEERDLELDLQDQVAEVWQDIVDNTAVQRKSRYE